MMKFEKIRELFNVENSCGIEENDILDAENDLGLMFPKILKDYYLQLGKNRLNFNQDFLLLPEGSESKTSKSLWIEDEMLVFYEENQCCHYWGIKKTDLMNDNPPVYRKEDGWLIDTENLYDFLVSMAFWQLNFTYESTAYCLDVNTEEIEETLLRFNKENYTFDKWNVEFYRNCPEELISVHRVEDESCHLYVMAQNVEGLNCILDLFDVEWDDIIEED